MLQLIIATVTIVSLYILNWYDEKEQDKKWKECEETNWNEYYANI